MFNLSKPTCSCQDLKQLTNEWVMIQKLKTNHGDTEWCFCLHMFPLMQTDMQISLTMAGRIRSPMSGTNAPTHHASTGPSPLTSTWTQSGGHGSEHHLQTVHVIICTLNHRSKVHRFAQKLRINSNRKTPSESRLSSWLRCAGLKHLDCGNFQRIWNRVE